MSGAEGEPYRAFLAPGLIMMAIINNSFANTVSSFFQAKMMKHLEELLVSSMSSLTILLGFLTGGVVRGLSTGLGVLLVSFFFAGFHLAHLGWVIFFAVGSAMLFSLLGLLNAVYAKTFDDISIVPTFFLTPMIYLGGVFYSVHMLSGIWKTLSLYNPLVYIINGFRYGFLGTSDVSVWLSAGLVFGSVVVLFLLLWWILEKKVNNG